MSDEHEHWEIHDLGVEFEVASNSLVQGIGPASRSLFSLRSCVHWDAVTPDMTNLSHFSFEILQFCILVISIAVFDKFQEETVKVSFDIYTLILWAVKLVDEHEIWVDFKTTTGSNHDADLVILTGAGVHFGDRAVLDELWSAELSSIHLDSKLDERESPRRVILTRLLVLCA